MKAENLYIEHKLNYRVALSLSWLPEHAGKILDAGCSYGYGTRFYLNHADEIHAIDINEEDIETAKQRYPEIKFKVKTLQETNYPDNYFDVVTANDILEHIFDRQAALNEVFRVLKSGGYFIISTPHKGLFSIFDPYNYDYYLKKSPLFFNPVYKIIKLIREGKIPKEFNPTFYSKHIHFSEKNIINMLNKSDFYLKYTIENIFKSGLIFDPLALNLEVILGIFLKENVWRKLVAPLKKIADFECSVNFGLLSYNIAVKIRKI